MIPNPIERRKCYNFRVFLLLYDVIAGGTTIAQVRAEQPISDRNRVGPNPKGF
jgi:hypothetical protein